MKNIQGRSLKSAAGTSRVRREINVARGVDVFVVSKEETDGWWTTEIVRREH
jgi:hypothetical protein